MKVSELSGPELDYWVAISNSLPGVDIRSDGCVYAFPRQKDETLFKPSSDWTQGGPIIEREKIGITPIKNNRWAAGDLSLEGNGLYLTGDTPLEAAMRCYVASKYGDEV